MVWCSKDVGRLIACISSIAVATFMVLPQENVDGRPQYGYLKESALLVDLEDMEEKKKCKKWLQEKKFPRTNPCFCLILPIALISLFFIFYLILLFTQFLLFGIFFYNILSMNDTRDTTNFTTYVLQISMSPIKK